ncbi:MAG: PAS domain S-box [Solidesulfovibrio magneticus str. Maddingley MBC34]|uniref:Sensory/regulatory protein RpfC n=1 Tax=Solidesulfovibrio magneticus str. Maddingley MBC34 TaxID=1206767 RepID=K6GUF9_9BACT|nr:MAG: PAS domain S-box [Solidesulfovibrio magneticus str. Maddingley MBC34]
MAKLHETPLRDLPPASPITLGLWTTAAQAARTLLGAGAGEALVLDGGRPLGVVTTRGLSKVLTHNIVQAAHLAVRDVMDPVAVSPESDYLPGALRHLLAAPSRRLAVVDAAGRAVGILAPFHVARLGVALDELAERTVASAMTRAVVTARVGEALPMVLARMTRLGVGGVVVAKDDVPCGVFTARDAVRLLAGGSDIRDMSVDEAMSAPVAVVAPQLPLAEGLAGMDGAGAGRLVVTDPDGFLLGLLTWTDVAAVLSGIVSDAEKARLHDQAERYRDLYDNAGQGLFRLDLQGRPVAVNAVLSRMLGYRDVADCLRQSRQPAHPLRLDGPSRRELLPRALSEAEPVTFEARGLRREGGYRRLACSVRAVRDAFDQPTGFEGACAEVPQAAFPGGPSDDAGYRSLIEHQTELICRFDPAGRLLFVNAAYARYWGKTPEACLAENFQPALHPDDAAMVGRRVASLCPHRPTTGYEVRVLRPDGRARYQRWTRRAIFDAAGELVEYQAVGRDITPRKLAEQSLKRRAEELHVLAEEKSVEAAALADRLGAALADGRRLADHLREKEFFLDAVLAGVQDGVCLLSPEMEVLAVNRSLRGMYASRGEIVGQRCHEVYHGLSAPCQDCPSLRAMATRKLAISVVPKDDPGDSAGWVELFCYPMLDAAGSVAAVVEIVRDVTAGKKLEAELAAALERAEAASQAKGAFLANMSHEIRTPLNAVLGYVQLMLRDRLEPAQRQRLAVVEESAATLLSIINDILDYSKIEAGRLEIKAESFDLAQCLAAVVKEQEVLAREKGLVLELEFDPGLPGSVRGDGLRLRQILRNLVNNAVKYTEHGSVTLRASLLDRSPCPTGNGERVTLRFAVIDTGVGIPTDQLPAIFDSFTQVDGGLTKRQAGTGLGLAICRRLAGLMGGGVFVDSLAGKGSVFWLECPFEAAAGHGGLARRDFGLPAHREPPQRLRVLLVEDNRVNRVFASDLLESRGHEVILAENGRAALEYLVANAVDVVLMDIQMPVMDGLAATRAIRAGHLDIDPGLPVIGLSAYAMDQERERFLAAGFDDYITKPIDVETFFAVVARVLARRGRAPVGALEAGRQTPPSPIDTQALATQYRGKAGLLTRVGREFVASVPEQLESLREAMDQGDLAVCERVAHTLKGNAAMFGASAMRGLAAEAEQAAAAGDVARLADLAPTLDQACREAVGGLDDYLCRIGN